MSPEVQTIIFVARSDAPFISHTLPHLFEMCLKAKTKICVKVDTRKPTGILAESIVQNDLQPILDTLEALQKEFSFEINLTNFKKEEVSSLNKFHFGKALRETHCFRGYPTFGSINQFHESNSDYILHLDCDMIFYESPQFFWVQEGIKVMEDNEDILCVLPKGGPPTKDGSLNQGTTTYEVDERRELYLFKNFTSRHYLIHRERFLTLLPIKPLWLSWREPIKSRLFGNGKMLCWEAMVENALENSAMWRADLMTDQGWSLHPAERSEEFYQLLPMIIDSVNQNEFPEEQRGHFDLRLNDWKHFLN